MCAVPLTLNYINKYINTGVNTTQNVFLRFKSDLLFYKHHYSDWVLGSEWCQNSSDVHSTLCLKASCIDTDGAVAAHAMLPL